MLRSCLAASKNNGKNGHFLPDSSGKNWVDKRFIARHKKNCHNLTRKYKICRNHENTVTSLTRKRSKGYSFAENDSFVIKNVKWEHNCQMQTVDWNFHRHVTAKSKTSMESFTDTFLLLVKSRWLLPPTLHIQKQVIDGIFHRHFPTECKMSMEFCRCRWIYLKNKNTSVSHQKEYGQEKFSNL